MKRRILTVVGIVAALIFALAVIPSANAEDSSHVWERTSIDGSVEYLDTFYSAFDVAEDGDIFRLIPEYIELEGHKSISRDISFTLDIGSSTLVYTDIEERTPYINIGGNSRVTLLCDGAEVYLGNNVSAFMAIKGNATLDVIGGDGRLSVYAPDAFEAGGNAVVTLERVFAFKNGGNMMGLVCARGQSQVTVLDSLLSSEKGMNAVYTQDTGVMTVHNSVITSLDGKSAFLVNTGSTLEICRGSYVFSEPTVKGRLVITDEVHTSFDPAPYIDGGLSVSVSTDTATLVQRRYVEAGKWSDASVEVMLGYYVHKDGSQLSEISDDAVWLIQRAGGEYYFTDSLVYPFGELSDGDSLTLLRDVECACLPSFTLDGSLTVDLGLYSVNYLKPDMLLFDSALFKATGQGELAVRVGTGRNNTANYTLVDATGEIGVKINLSSSDILLQSLSRLTGGASLECSGGTVNCLEDSISLHGGGYIRLDSVFIGSRSDRVVVTDGTLDSLGSYLVTGGECAIDSTSRVRILSGGAVCGSVNADSLSCDTGIYTSVAVPDCEGLIYRPTSFRIPEGLYAFSDGITLSYITDSLMENIKYGFTLSGYVTMSVYIPSFVFDYTVPEVHISVDGLTYTPTLSEYGTAYLDSERYHRLYYPYIYQSDLLQRGELVIRIGEWESVLSFTPRDLILTSLEGVEDERILSVAAGYLNYALFASYDLECDRITEQLFGIIDSAVTVAGAEEISGIIQSVYLDSENSELVIYLTDKTASSTITFGYHGEKTARKADGGVLRVPFYRLDPQGVFTLWLTDSVEDSVSFTLGELYSLVADSPSRSSELLRRYLYYITLIYG